MSVFVTFVTLLSVVNALIISLFGLFGTGFVHFSCERQTLGRGALLITENL
jgi:hypothetical protein